MKKATLFFGLFLTFISADVFSQAREELNFGLVGINYEIPVHRDITIAPGVVTDFDLNWITVHVNGNYYFDHVFGIKDNAWDVYGGIGAGYGFYNGKKDKDNDIDLGLHVGGRWFWNDKWGIYLQLGGYNTRGASGGLGLTVKL